MEQGELNSSPDHIATDDSHDEESGSPERFEPEEALDIKPPQVKLPKKKDKHKHKKRSMEKERRKHSRDRADHGRASKSFSHEYNNV